jgi:uncharacterized protein (DUF433 family)
MIPDVRGASRAKILRCYSSSKEKFSGTEGFHIQGIGGFSMLASEVRARSQIGEGNPLRRIDYAFDGSYPAIRAAALSGVPVSTVYLWARTGIVVPSVSEEKEKLWSYADLMALRIVYWLRHPKQDVNKRLPASPMSEVRRVLSYLDQMGLDIWAEKAELGPSPLRVNREGKIFVVETNSVSDVHGQTALDGSLLNLLGPFSEGQLRGPDLLRPRPHLRIVPGKCAGEPHLSGTRITTPSVSALARSGFQRDDIARLYPDRNSEAIAEAIDLEEELENARWVA